MERVKNSVLSKWRLVLGALFVMTVFVLPGTKGMFAKFFNVTVEAGGHNHSRRGGYSNNSQSRSYGSVSCPSSQSTASPMSNTYSSHGSCGSHQSCDSHNRHSRSFRSGGSTPNPK